MSVSRKVVFLVMGADGSGKAGLTVNTDFFAYYKIGAGTATAITSATDEGNGFYSASVSADTTDEVILTGKYDDTDASVTLPVVGWPVSPWVVSTFDAANDGVILGATQSNYAPAKAGDAMTLTSAYDAAKGAAGANATATGFATPSDLTTLQTHGDSTWATATGFATPSDLTTLQTHGDSNWATADVSALATSAGLSSLQTHGDSNWATADVSGLATGASITSLQSHGDSSWATATGFATPSDLTTLQTHGDSEWATADVSGLATGASITSLQSHGDSSWATATGFSTFDPANDTVAHVTLVDTTTTNTDMRGTDNAYTGTPPSADDLTGAMTAAGFSKFNAATDAVKVSMAQATPGGNTMGGQLDKAGTATFSGEVTATVDAQTVANALNTAPTGDADDGSVNDMLGNLAGIRAATSLITAGTPIVVNNKINQGTLTLYKGDSYSDDEGTAITLTEPTGSGWPTDLTDYTLALDLTKDADNPNTGDATASISTVTVSPATGTGRTITIELTAAQTATLAENPKGRLGYRWAVKATSGSNVSTLAGGGLSVLP